MGGDHVQDDCALAPLQPNAQRMVPADARDERPVGHSGNRQSARDSRRHPHPPLPPAIRLGLLSVERREVSVPVLPLQACVPALSGGPQSTGLHTSVGRTAPSSIRASLGSPPSTASRRGTILRTEGHLTGGGLCVGIACRLSSTSIGD